MSADLSRVGGNDAAARSARLAALRKQPHAMDVIHNVPQRRSEVAPPIAQADAVMQSAATEAVNRAAANATAPVIPQGQPRAQNAPADDLDGRTVNLIRADSIKPEPVRWLWEHYLAEGKLHILAGQPGTGKTTIALALAAAITRGGKLPDGTRAPVGDVAIWSGEDALGDTLVPRLLAAGADMTRVRFVGGLGQHGEEVPFDPSVHFPLLARAVSALPRLRLLVIDSVVSVVAGDSHKNAEVRRALQSVVDFAESRRCAVIGITHFTKGTQGREPLERVTGSLAFGAVARVVFSTAKMEEGGHVFVRAKSNVGPDSGGFKYNLQQERLAVSGIVASRVVWGEAVDGSASAILASAERKPDHSDGGDSKDFLRNLLTDGPMKATAVFTAATANGFSQRQMQRARKVIGALCEKQGMDGGWEWRLPKMPPSPEEGSTQNYPAPSASSASSAPSKMPPTSEDTEDDTKNCSAPSSASSVASPSAVSEVY